MKKQNSYRESLEKFVSGKGFYIALAVCLIGAAVASWVAVNSTINGIENNNSRMESEMFTTAPPADFGLITSPPTDQSTTAPAPAQTTASAESISAAPETTAPQQAPSSEGNAVLAPSSEVPEPLVFVMPVDSQVFASYSDGELVKNMTLGDWRSHNGVDIAAEAHSPVLSAANGMITRVYSDPLWGSCIDIQHGENVLARYCGVIADPSIDEGVQVSVGQIIGQIDSIPCESSLQNHLHFETRVDGQLANPLEVLGKVAEEEPIESQALAESAIPNE